MLRDASRSQTLENTSKTPTLGPVDKRFNPKPRGGDIEEAHEGQGGFVVAGCNTPHLLEFVEHPLNAIAVSVTPPVCFLWSVAAFA